MKVIVFQGQSQYDVLRTYSTLYSKNFRESGIEAITCDMNIVDQEMYLRIADKFQPDFTLGFSPVCYIYEDNTLHFHKTQIPHLVWLGDSPYYHVFDRALINPNDPLVFSFITERFFENGFKELGVNRYDIKTCSPAEQNSPISYKNKIYPIVFFGSYTDPNKIIQRLKEVCKSELLLNAVLNFCSMIKDHVVTVKSILREPIEVYFSSYLLSEYKLDRDQITLFTKEFYYYIDHYYRNLIRQVVLTTFAEENLDMFVFGREDTQALLDKYPNVRVFQPVCYSEYIDILSHSMVAINITPMFTSFHERISTTLLNSTLLCTNIMEDLITKHPKVLNSAIFYDLGNLKETAQVIKEIINNEEDYSTLIDNGLKLGREEFSFEKDIEETINIFKSNF